MPPHSSSEYDVLHAIYRRRAVRAYQAEQPDQATIGELLQAAVQAPTAMHLEPWAFAVVQNRALLKRWSDRAKAMLLEPPGAVGWGSLPPRHRDDHAGRLADPDFNIFYDAGTLIVVCRRTHGPFAEADCWLAAENLMLAAAARGLGTCVIGFAVPVLNTREVRLELDIPDEGAAVAPILLGLPRGETPPVPRRPPQMLRWIR